MKRLYFGIAIAAFLVVAASSSISAAPKKAPAVPKNVPELMKSLDGKKISSVQDWEKIRRPEILKTFTEQVFGVRPLAVSDPSKVTYKIRHTNEMYGGKVIREVVDATYNGPKGKYVFTFISMRPKASRPLPVFLAFFLEKGNLEKLTENPNYKDSRWPVEDIISRGYATVAITKNAIAYDDKVKWCKTGFLESVESLESRKANSWATISIWAWGNSRVMDWIESRPDVFDAKHVGVVGHSRGGKTALWTGATDQRFALAASVQSGCGGAKLNHIHLPWSEHIHQITKNFPYWFCRNYLKYRHNEKNMPFDQHMLASLIAPRLLVVCSATNDAWAGPLGEWWTAKLSSPAWELYGKKGLVGEKMPKVNTLQAEGSVAYFIRTGKHSITEFEWARFMDVADKNGWNPKK
jgi:hypothetical protein